MSKKVLEYAGVYRKTTHAAIAVCGALYALLYLKGLDLSRLKLPGGQE